MVLESVLEFLKNNINLILLFMIGLIMLYIIYYFYYVSKYRHKYDNGQDQQVYRIDLGSSLGDRTKETEKTEADEDTEEENEETEEDEGEKEVNKENEKEKINKYEYKNAIEELMDLCQEDFNLNTDEISSDDENDDHEDLIEEMPNFTPNEIKLSPRIEIITEESEPEESEEKHEEEIEQHEVVEKHEEAEKPETPKTPQQTKKINLMNRQKV